jgi:hypothetical protein
MSASFNYSGAATTGSAPSKDSLTLERMKDLLDQFAASEPKQWVLISPFGVVTVGENPMVLAARSTHFSDLRLPPFRT